MPDFGGHERFARLNFRAMYPGGKWADLPESEQLRYLAGAEAVFNASMDVPSSEDIALSMEEEEFDQEHN